MIEANFRSRDIKEIPPLRYELLLDISSAPVKRLFMSCSQFQAHFTLE